MLYRFHLELSDVDRGVYETLDFRVAQHPSETAPYLLSRVLAYALAYQEGLQFSGAGLGDPDAPALRAMGANGTTELWIEIGNPAAKKLHRASKAARRVLVFTYKNPEVLLSEIREENVHRAAELGLYAFDPAFLRELEGRLEKQNQWTVLHQGGQLDLTAGGQSLSSQVSTLVLRLPPTSG